jgi:hypothetical protein
MRLRRLSELAKQQFTVPVKSMSDLLRCLKQPASYWGTSARWNGISGESLRTFPSSTLQRRHAEPLSDGRLTHRNSFETPAKGKVSTPFGISSWRRREFSELIELAYALPNLADELRNDVLLRRLQFILRSEGNKVVASNERLVAQLRRVLDGRQSADGVKWGGSFKKSKHWLTAPEIYPCSSN